MIKRWALLLFSILTVTLWVAGSASGQEGRRYQNAQTGYDIFIDDRGQRFLIDPYDHVIIGYEDRNRRISRRALRRANRALRRLRRLEAQDRQFDDLFQSFEQNDRNSLRARNRQAHDRERGSKKRGFFLDELKGAFKSRSKRLRGQETPARGSENNPSNETQTARVQSAPSLPERNYNRVSFGMKKPRYNKSQMASLQVFLDRKGFSPGVIDGRWGSNVAKAVDAWKQATGEDADLGNANVLERYVAQSGGPVFTSYRISAKDVAGPYIASVPVDYAKKAALNHLSYTSIEEMLAEKFHMSQRYLKELNKGKNFRRAGTRIQVIATGAKQSKKVYYIHADKSKKQVRAYGRNGNLVAAYPATIGSSATPSPVGTHSVARVAINPGYTYNPKINFTQGENRKVLSIPPGPNGPVGSVWIALSKPTYGIHGTPNPDTIGKTNSHGCIRLTNWDALELAKLVRKGVTVEFIE